MNMMNSSVLVTYASWEDRFLLGTEKALKSGSYSYVFMVYSREYAEWTATNRLAVRRQCADIGIACFEELVSSLDPNSIWQHASFLKANIEKLKPKLLTLDITTMPRDAIWTLLYHLENTSECVEYVYRKPREYGSTWVSNSQVTPRLINKHSGVAQLGRPTSVLVLTGFDIERTFQFYDTYEPSHMILGFQSGGQFGNSGYNISLHMHRLLQYSNVKITTFEFDTYADDRGFSLINQQITGLQDTNIIATSIGPKLSAIALYKVWRSNREIALAYAPAGQYDMTYSTGMGKEFSGRIW